ncbi:hypothetical protein [Geopseudomonas aromaticivorans]
MLKHCMLGMALAVAAGAAHAGPFGLEMGESLAQLQGRMALTKVGEYQYGAKATPKSHPAFEEYLLVITPKHGLCKVMAATPDIKSSSFGTEVQGKFESLEAAVTSRYGAGEKLDFLKKGSIWDDPNEWMMALVKKERSLMTYWGGKGKSLQDNVAMIQLSAGAHQSSAGYVTLGYEFKNSDSCLDWINAQQNESL